MGITRQPTVIDPKPHPFLTEFLDPAGSLTAVCPLYVTGLCETANGVAIRTARGAVADQFFVAGPARDVVNRLKAAWDEAHDSFLASFLRGDMGMLEDHLMKRLLEQLPSLGKVENAVIANVVRCELEKMAAGEPATTNAPPKGKRTPLEQRV